MSQENVDLVLSQFAATNAGDFAAAHATLAEDVVLVVHGAGAGIAGPGAEGKRAVGRWFTDWFGTFEPEYHFAIGEIRGAGDQVYVEATHHGRGKISGALVTMPSFWVFTVRDRAIVRMEAYPDRDTAVGALG